MELEKDKTYRIDMKGQILSSPGLDIPGEPVDPELTLSLPQINAIYDADGGYLFNTWSHDESKSHHLFRVTFHAHDRWHPLHRGERRVARVGRLRADGSKTSREDDGDDGDDTNAQRRGPKTCVRSRRRAGSG